MKNFNPGAWHPARDDARATHVAAANDLVRRTLAQHGLLGDAGIATAPGATAQPDVMRTVQDALAQAGLSGKARTAEPMTLPAGAAFRQASFKGRSGTRNYRTYVPAACTGTARGIVMMLHGCTQTPEDFAAGTGMNALAEEHGFVVIYPEQSRGANAQTCWNWFSPNDQARGRGEPEILAGIAKQAMAEFDVPADRTFVAGLSAGAAMALILGAAYGDVFAAVGAHSGLPVGAATDVASAFAAMAGQTGLKSAPATDGTAARRCIVFHGTADRTVTPANGDAIAQQAEAAGPAQTLQTTEQGKANGRSFERRITLGPDGAALVESWRVDGLGHAWSGGQPAGSYTDPQGPDASAEMVRFFFETQNEDH